VTEFRYGHIRSFGTRRGHLTDRQREAVEQLSDTYCLPFQKALVNTEQIFGNSNPLVMEIGCGMGETTVAIAANNPAINYFGVEVYPAGVGSLLARIDDTALKNVRVISHDAVEVLEQMIAPASLAGVHVFFPDPWHKKRHHKRRLIQPPMVELVVSRLQDGGYIHCATDWEPYAEQMLEVLGENTNLLNEAGPEQWLARPDWRPTTKFETRGLRLNHRVRDLRFKRRQTSQQFRSRQSVK